MSEAQPTSPVSPEADNSGDIYNPRAQNHRTVRTTGRTGSRTGQGLAV